MKNLLCCLLLISSSSLTLSAQIVEIQSTSEGITIPKMTQTQRNNIASLTEGLLIYQTDNSPGFYFYNGSSWESLGGTGGGGDIIHLNGLSILFGTNTRYSILGSGNSASLAFAQYVSPKSGNLKNLICKAGNQAVDVGATVNIAVNVNGSNSALAVSLTNADGTNFKENTVSSVSISKGELISLEFKVAAGSLASNIALSCFCELE